MGTQKSSEKPLNNDFQFVNVSRLTAAKKSLITRRQTFEEIYHPHQPHEAQAQAHRCIDCGNPYCEWKCPVHNYIPNWLHLVNEGKIIEAAELCHQTNSLPEVCGRVCPQDRLCEGACTLNESYGAVTIGSIEKYITDTAFSMGWRPDLSQVIKQNKRVAVIGAGPAGLACADVLIRQGVTPVVFDRYPEIGGLLTFGIPEFKLEKSVIQRRKAIFSEMGVEFKLNMEVGKDISIESLIEKFDAVFMGMGTYNALPAHLPGADLPGIYQALPYLIGNTCHINNVSNAPYPLQSLKDKHVVVLGGGDTAMDCNRTAIRQGAKTVTCLYRRSEKEMPGSKNEIKNAKEEGVRFIFNRQPIRFHGEERITGITCSETESAQTPHSTYKILAGREEYFEADAAIIAFGFQASPASWFKDISITTHDNGLVNTQVSNTYTFQTNHPKIFAGGDMVHGADLVVTAIADGRSAAEEIITYISNR